mgnify:CR=1 FL=1
MRGSFAKYVASIDAHGSPIPFTFRGNDKFSTPCGGLITMLANLFLALALVLMAQKFVLRFEPTIISYEVAFQPEDSYNLLENRLVVMVKLKGFRDDQIDPRAGKLTAHSKGTEVNLHKCSLEDDYKGIDLV